jgi:hypothetical protein
MVSIATSGLGNFYSDTGMHQIDENTLHGRKNSQEHGHQYIARMAIAALASQRSPCRSTVRIVSAILKPIHE